MQLMRSQSETVSSMLAPLANFGMWFPPAANDSGGFAFAWCKSPAADP
jgi:hypothetical protein